MTQHELDILFEDAKYENIVSFSETHETSNLDQRKIALAYYHTEEYNKSLDLFQEICKNSNDSVDWFNLSASAIFADNERLALDALSQAKRFNKETKTDGKGIPTPFMILLAAKNFATMQKFNLAFNQLNELAWSYQTSTDDNTLYEKGIPAFSEFIRLLKIILPKQTVFSTPKDWIEQVASKLDEQGKARIMELV